MAASPNGAATSHHHYFWQQVIIRENNPFGRGHRELPESESPATPGAPMQNPTTSAPDLGSNLPCRQINLGVTSPGFNHCTGTTVPSPPCRGSTGTTSRCARCPSSPSHGRRPRACTKRCTQASRPQPVRGRTSCPASTASASSSPSTSRADLRCPCRAATRGATAIASERPLSTTHPSPGLVRWPGRRRRLAL
eukprot:5605249-Prymnesium_polylepis.1